MHITLIDPQVRCKIYDQIDSYPTAMNLMDKVREKLKGTTTLWAMAISESELPAVDIINTIKDCIVDNRAKVARMLGEELTNDILNFS